MSRPRKPFNELLASGAMAHDPQRFRDRQPEPISDEPLGDPPPHFDAAQRKVWRELAKNAIPGVLCSADRIAMELLVSLVVMSRKGTAKAGDRNTMVGLMSRLGMTPSDRTKLVAKPQKQSENDEFLILKPGDKLRKSSSVRRDFSLQTDTTSVPEVSSRPN